MRGSLGLGGHHVAYSTMQTPRSLASLGMTMLALLAPVARPLRRCRCTRLRLVEMHYHSPRRLLQRELIVPQRLVDLQLQHIKSDVVLLLRPVNLDARRKTDAVVVLIVRIPGVGRQVAQLIVNVLAMRLQVGAAEDNFARQFPTLVEFSNYHQLVVFLKNPVSLGVMKNLVTILQDRDLVFRIDRPDQNRIVNILRPDALHRLVWVIR